MAKHTRDVAEVASIAGPDGSSLLVELNAVIASVDQETPQVLCLGRGRAGAPAALPSGPLDAERDRTLELALRSWVRDQTELELGYVEQLYTFGDRYRDPRERAGGPRVISISYLALVRQGLLSAGRSSEWRDWYAFLPWEDQRLVRPPVIDRLAVPRLDRWIAGAPDGAARRSRLERATVNFGLRGVPWDEERVLERYQLLFELGLVPESSDGDRDSAVASPFGEAMASDHRRILATALGRLRGKLKYRPLVFELLPSAFTLTQLQRVVEALAGRRLHKQNFRRLVEKGGLVEGTGSYNEQTGGRPAELFRFRQAVLRERPAPGLGLPAARGESSGRG
jgi:hypothetical protein